MTPQNCLYPQVSALPRGGGGLKEVVAYYNNVLRFTWALIREGHLKEAGRLFESLC